MPANYLVDPYATAADEDQSPAFDDDAEFLRQLDDANRAGPVAKRLYDPGLSQDDTAARQYLADNPHDAGSDLVPGMVGVTNAMLHSPPPTHAQATLPSGLINETGHGIDGVPTIPVPPTQPRPQQPQQNPWQQSLDALKAEIAKRPDRTPPKWWQQVISGALGGAAGWSNAASRTRNPIDIKAQTESILHPGYAEKLADWQSRVDRLQGVAQIEGQKQAGDWKTRQIDAEANLKNEQAASARMHGYYWLSRSEQERNQWKIDAKTGILYNTITGEKSSTPPTPKDRYETAKALGATELEAREYALNGKIEKPPAPHNTSNAQMYLDRVHGDPALALELMKKDRIDIAKQTHVPRDPFIDYVRAEDLKRRAEQDNDAVNTRLLNAHNAADNSHNTQLRLLENAANLVLRSPNHTEQEKAAARDHLAKEKDRINAEWAQEKQTAYNNWVQAGRARGRQMNDYKINPDGSWDLVKSNDPAGIRPKGKPDPGGIR